jgi:class 3 adenylate cyclase
VGTGPELPSGTVTFLFTDIEGSTALLKQLGRDEYENVLAEHAGILRAAFAAHGGQVVDTQGDSFFAAFRAAREAVAAAVEAQRELAAAEWPDSVEVRVRMGLHSGEPKASGERYVGIGVHRAARVGGVAHGGQVLLSDATRVLVEDDLPAGVYLRDLGAYRLKDIERPERISQVTAEGLPSEFPPLRGAERRPARRRLVWVVAAGATLVAAAIAATVALSDNGSHKPKPVAVAANSIAAIDPASNTVVTDTPVGSSPEVTTGLGAVWVANLLDGTVFKIDPRTAQLLASEAIGSFVFTIATGAGSLWAVDPVARAVWALPVGDLSTRYLQPIKFPPVHGLGFPGPIAVGYGSVWLGLAAPANQLLRLNPSSGAVVARIHGVPIGNLPSREINTGGVAIGGAAPIGGGEVWVSAVNGVLLVYTSENQIANRFAIPDGPGAIAVGLGATWVVVPNDNTLWRIDASNQTMRPIAEVGNYPTGVTVGDGSVWVANEKDGTIQRVDPHSGKALATIHVGHSPSSVAVGYGRVWVAVQAP